MDWTGPAKVTIAAAALVLTAGTMTVTGVSAFYSLKGDVRVMNTEQHHIREDIAVVQADQKKISDDISSIRDAMLQIAGDSRVRAEHINAE